jgi:hypothetical protein
VGRSRRSHRCRGDRATNRSDDLRRLDPAARRARAAPAAALAWFAAAGENTGTSEFVTDEGVITRELATPEFRQVVDYDMLLEANPFGQTVAVERSAYARLADRLASQSIAAARGSLWLGLARKGHIGHIPCVLVAHDDKKVVDPEVAAVAHEQALRAHVAAAGLDERLAIGFRSQPTPRSTLLWRPRVADTPIAAIIPTRDNGQDLRRRRQPTSRRSDRERCRLSSSTMAAGRSRRAGSSRISRHKLGRS